MSELCGECAARMERAKADGKVRIIGIMLCGTCADAAAAEQVAAMDRAAVERAGAMEALLLRLEWSGYQQGDQLAARCCPECSWPASEARKHDPACALGTLLAEIDAAKAGG